MVFEIITHPFSYSDTKPLFILINCCRIDMAVSLTNLPDDGIDDRISVLYVEDTQSDGRNNFLTVIQLYGLFHLYPFFRENSPSL